VPQRVQAVSRVPRVGRDPGGDPARNMNRFYVVEVTPTLFGEWAVLREWGRRGSPGTLRLDSYRRREEAQSAEQRTFKRRLQWGYTAI
jgi:predicted DNA-binding WGR domain protein